MSEHTRLFDSRVNGCMAALDVLFARLHHLRSSMSYDHDTDRLTETVDRLMRSETHIRSVIASLLDSQFGTDLPVPGSDEIVTASIHDGGTESRDTYYSRCPSCGVSMSLDLADAMTHKYVRCHKCDAVSVVALSAERSEAAGLDTPAS